MEVVRIRNFSKLLFVISLVFLVLSFSLINVSFVFAQTNQVASKLQSANKAIDQAFNAVLDAEKVGGNITQLLIKLNTAGELLAEAQNAYNGGNTANVTSLAENAYQIANQVKGDAINLRDDSLLDSQYTIWFTLIFSIVGAVVFSVILFLIWRRFKRAHMMKVLGMRPEVVENTT